MRYRTTDYFSDIEQGSRVVIYGTGERGRALYDSIRELRPDIQVPFWLDSFEAGMLGEKEILTPNMLAARKYTYDGILIASAYSAEIMENLPSDIADRTSRAGGGLCHAGARLRGESSLYPDLSIELTTYCNMRCEFCTHRLYERKNRHMDIEQFAFLLDEVVDSNFTDHISLGLMGEPLVYPHIEQAVKECVDRKLKTTMITNGVLLTPETYKRLHDLGLSGLQFSLHDFTEESFAYRRAAGGMSYAKYRAQLFDCLDLYMKENYTSLMNIVVSFMKRHDPISRMWDMEPSLAEGDDAEKHVLEFGAEIEALAHKNDYALGIDYERIQEVLAGIDLLRKEAFVLDLNDSLRFVISPIFPHTEREMAELRPDYTTRFRYVGPDEKEHCSGADGASISVDGHLFVCGNAPCYPDDFAELSMGRITPENRLRDIVSTDRFQRPYRAVLLGELPHEYCKKCKGSYEFIGGAGEENNAV
ncbi:radical SAM protein [Pseudodesulfovibrio sp.]|nr:radical SAM protein [Pseudodesulfovibrio sp.]